MSAPFLPYGRQSIDEADIAAVVEVLKSDFLTQGPAIGRFEKAVSDFCGARHGIAMANGTATLHCAAKALGLGHGDRLWTSPITFGASANAGRYCGAKVDFVDVDPGTGLMCPERLEAKLVQAEKEGALPRVVVPVHFAGQSCDMPRIHALGQKYGFKILEDAAHALGGEFEGRRIGGCDWSDAASHSFHPVKIVTSGEGGMITTNDPEVAWRIGLLRGVPLSVGVAVVAVAFAVRGTGGQAEAMLGALANLVPPLLMALFFMRREMPRIELPRVPRSPPASSWQPWPAPGPKE